jgi:hypothetical protein
MICFYYMDQNLGSFGRVLGGGASIAEAMKRRNMGQVSANQVQSPASAVQPPIPETAQANAALGVTQAAPSPEQPDSEVMIATKALATMVTNDSKMKRDMAAPKPLA